MEQFFVFLQKNPMNMVLFGTVLVTAGMLVWPLVGRLIRPGRDVGPVEAVQLINRRDAVVLDVRDTGDYNAGHIANARHIPEGQVAERLKELEKYKLRPIVVSDRTGARAPVVTGMLRKHGFAEAVALRGGVTAWQQASLPLEKA